MRENIPCLLTEEAVGNLIGRSPKTLKRWRRENEGPAWVRIGKTPRYDARDVAAWMIRNRVQPHPERAQLSE
jgi:hypothetical protein